MVIWVLEWMNMPLCTGIIRAINALVLLDQCVCHCTILLIVIDINIRICVQQYVNLDGSLIEIGDGCDFTQRRSLDRIKDYADELLETHKTLSCNSRKAASFVTAASHSQ